MTEVRPVIFGRWWKRWRSGYAATAAAIAPLFDRTWYLSCYPDVRAAGVDPLRHYVEFGHREGRNPHPLFDTAWYLARYHDAARTGLNPLLHYLRIGARKGYDPSPLFDSGWYTSQNPDLRGNNPLLHFLQIGGLQDRSPHPLFHSQAYTALYPVREGESAVALIRFISNAAAAGYKVVRVDRRFAPYLAIGVRHKDGQEDAWLFDADMRRMPDDIALWPADALAALDLHLEDACAIWRDLICAPRPQLGDRSRDIFINGILFQYGHDVLARSLERWQGDIGLPSREIEIGNPAAPPYSCGDVRLHGDLLGELLSSGESTPSHMVLALTTGSLTLRSPVDGRPLQNEGSMVLTPQLIAYRLVDTSHGLVFYLISPILGWAQARAIYVPQHQLLFVSPGWNSAAIERLYGADIPLMMGRHALSHAADIERYLQTPHPLRPALVFAQANIAHHLWNELGELDRLAAAEAAPPDIILIDGGKTEHFGAIDILFPEYSGRVQRSVSASTLANHIYGCGLCLFGPTSKYVSAGLRARVQGYSVLLGTTDPTRALHAAVAHRGPVIVIGLRSHNRTLVNFAEVSADIAECVLREFDHVTIVFDGWSNHGIPDYIDAEKQIVAQFARLFQDTRVTIIDLIGHPMAETLFWIAHADFFVSVYGAGMSKYRWISNKPGLLLTGRWNLHHRDDLDIYDSHEYMETPTPMLRVRPDEVEDEPGATTLRKDVLHAEGAQTNFRVNKGALLRYLKQLLTQHVPRDRNDSLGSRSATGNP